MLIHTPEWPLCGPVSFIQVKSGGRFCWIGGEGVCQHSPGLRAGRNSQFDCIGAVWGSAGARVRCGIFETGFMKALLRIVLNQLRLL